jgi:microsomal dipeptidase-like Zn-dependent dipeptidase
MRLRRPLLLVALLGVLATATAGTAGAPARPGAATMRRDDPERARRRTPEDRYAFAGGCYVGRSLATGRYVTRAGGTFAATAADAAHAEAFRFQALDLGKYLLYATAKDFLATDNGPLPAGPRVATDTASGYVKGTGDETLKPARDPLVGAVGTVAGASDPGVAATRSGKVVVAAKPSATAEWVVRAAPAGFVLQQAVDDHDEATPGPLDPPIAGTLTADPAGALSLSPGAGTAAAQRFSFELTDGCAAWPEPEIDVTGAPYQGATPYEETKGYLDAHLHGMAFEFLGGKARCGRPWHPYGVTYALVDCPDHEPGGRGAVLEQVLSGGNPGDAHDTQGWPTFGYWPNDSSLTHEQVYYTWLERAWRGGLRMFTNLLVENNVLCELYPYKRNSCNEMDAVHLQAQRLRELERYIDAQSGGPGEGWFRIVTDPFEARRVVNAGKLAVVMGIEVSVPFDCGEYLGVARCTAAEIDSRLDEVYALGVRQMELTNKFDNALTGVTGDSGTQGPIVNAGNKYETGHFWKMQTCADTHTDRHDKLQTNFADSSDGQVGRDAIFGGVLQVFGPTGAAPVYPGGPHCNTIGLSELGKGAIAGLIKRGMVFDPDHMSALAREQALDFVRTRGYSGVVSSHSWADDPTYKSILTMGGVVTPHAGSSTSFVEQWRKLRTWADPRYTFGLGYGSDVNGFSAQGAPRNPAPGTGVQYPFTGLGGVTIDKQRSGQRVYDVNTNGVDHYGLYPDWVEDGRLVAGADGAAFAADMQRGVESYLQMWERAVGVAPDACRPDVTDLTRDDLRGLRRMTPEDVLGVLGQPSSRNGTAFTYCVADGTATVTFGRDGRVASVA